MVTLALLLAPRRLFAVVRSFLPLFVTYARDRRRFLLFGGRRRPGEAAQRRRAERLLAALLSLGPTFIKLGQLLSTRPDVLPPAYIDVLTQLQDRVPPAPYEEAEAVIEAEFGPVEEAFEAFDEEAISGASLGQVYTARFEGEPVAVKVRRPGVEDLVKADLRVLRWILPVLLLFVDESRAFSLSNLTDEFDKTIREEMDYVREARILQEIRGNFGEEEGIRIPALVPERSGATVMTMAYVPGTKITDVEALDERGLDRTDLARRLEVAYIRMFMDHGVFHADPHPGNLAVQDDGTIVFYDFGMSGRLDDVLQGNIVDFYVAIAERDIDGIIDVLQRMGTISPDADRALMAEVLELAIRDARGQAIEQYRVQRIVRQVEDTMYEFPFRLPRNLALVLRVATVLEGVCVTLDPEFDFIEVIRDYLVESGFREESVRQFVSSTRDDLVEAAQSGIRVPPKLERTLDTIERENLRVEAAIVDPKGELDRLGRRITYAVLLAAGALITSLVFVDAGDPRLAIVPGVFTALVAFLLWRSLRRPRRLAVQPQFTRQGLERQRRGGGRE